MSGAIHIRRCSGNLGVPFAMALGAALSARAEPTPAPSPERGPEPEEHASNEATYSPTTDIVGFDLVDLLSVEVGVGATETANLRNVPAVVEVLTAEEIEALGVRDLREALLTLTGTYQRAHQSVPVFAPTVRLRSGFGSHRMLLLVDDCSQMNVITETALLHDIPISAVDRIEFLRGPASTLYGSGAMVAVVRVVTKKGPQTGYGTTLLGDPIGGGADASAYATTATHLWDRPVTARIDVQARRTEDATIRLLDETGQAGMHPQRVATLATLATLQYRDAYVRLRQHMVRGHMLGLLPILAFDPDASVMQLYGAEAGFTADNGALSWHVLAALDYGIVDADVGKLPPMSFAGRTAEENRSVWKMRYFAAQATAQTTYTFESGSLSGGLQYRRYEVPRAHFVFRNDGTHNGISVPADFHTHATDASLFALAELELSDRIRAVAGARLTAYRPFAEHHSTVPDEELDQGYTLSPMPTAALVAELTDAVSAKLLYGRAYRLPNLLELYGDIPSLMQASGHLDAEEQDTFEVAVDAALGRDLSLRANAYYSRFSGTIEMPTTVPMRFSNRSDVIVSYGSDLTVKWRPTRVLQVHSALTLQQAAAENMPPSEAEPVVISVTRLQVALLSDNRLTLGSSIWACGEQNRAQKKSRARDYDLQIHATLRWRPYESLTVVAVLRNALGTSEHLPYEPEPVNAYLRRTRALRLGLALDF